MIEGIDVSYANPLNIDWKTAAANGIKFAYVKATDGVGTLDPKFLMHVQGARTASLKIGAYHYLRVRAGKPQDADRQADQFCDAYLSAKCELLPVLDCEGGGNEKCTPSEWLEAIRTWVKRVRERLGVDPIIYTYPAFWMGLGPSCKNAADLGKLKLWIAHYTPAAQPLVPQPWQSWLMWQYAAGVGVIGRVPGVPNVVDRNKLNAVDLNVIARPTAPVTEAPPTPALPQLEPIVAVDVPSPSVGIVAWLGQLISQLLNRGGQK